MLLEKNGEVISERRKRWRQSKKTKNKKQNPVMDEISDGSKV